MKQKRWFLRFSCFLIAAILTGWIFSFKKQDVEKPDRLLENGRVLLDAIETFSPSAVVTHVSSEDLSAMIYTILQQRSDLFWLSSSYRYEQQGETMRIWFSYITGQDEAVRVSDLLARRAQELLTKIDDSLSIMERTREIHDRLLSFLNYHRESSKMPLADALLSGSANCEGYARALQYLLMKAGIQSYYITGDAGGPHAWVMVQDEEGTWMHVDPTFDDVVCEDGTAFCSHAYFWVSDQDLSRTHSWETAYEKAPIPVAEGVSYPSITDIEKTETFLLAAKQALQTASVQGNGAAELLFLDGMNEQVLSKLDSVMMQQADTFGVEVKRRVVSKNSRVVSYILEK